MHIAEGLKRNWALNQTTQDFQPLIKQRIKWVSQLVVMHSWWLSWFATDSFGTRHGRLQHGPCDLACKLNRNVKTYTTSAQKFSCKVFQHKLRKFHFGTVFSRSLLVEVFPEGGLLLLGILHFEIYLNALACIILVTYLLDLVQVFPFTFSRPMLLADSLLEQAL